MIRLIVNDVALDLPPNLRVNIRRNNPAYLGQDVGVIKSGFSYPFDIPLTTRNRQALGHPDRLDSATAPVTNLPAQLYAGADLFMVGRLNVLRAGKDTAKVAFINNPLQDLTKLKLSEVDLGNFSYANVNALLANMRDTQVNPLDRPFICFPVFNATLNPTPEEVVPSHNQFQNSYDFDTADFRTNLPMTLFMRVEYVLRKALESAGFSWTDLFHTSPEHKRICLINNRALNNEGGPVTLAAAYNIFMPEETVASFLKNYCRLFGLAPFTSLSGTDITLQPLNSLVNAPVETDWSEYAGAAYEREANKNIALFRHPEPSELVYRFDRWENRGKPDVVVADFPNPPVPNILYYVESRNSYVKYYLQEDGSFLGDFRSSYGEVINDSGSEELIPNLVPVQQSQVLFYPVQGDNLLLPVWGADLAPPIISGTNVQGSKVEHQLAIYRGQQSTSSGRVYPFGSANNYRVDFTPIAGENLSLRWLGNNGLYANHWREWDTMLQLSGAVERSFILPLRELINFDFRRKVRVGNQNHFVRGIEFSLSNDGVSPAKCDLVVVP
jgi:hypothetical protein